MDKFTVIQELLAKTGGAIQHSVNGLPVPFIVQQEEVDKLKDFQLYPDDVWVVTYPKMWHHLDAADSQAHQKQWSER